MSISNEKQELNGKIQAIGTIIGSIITEKGAKGDTGRDGSNGKNLEFNWDGTKLGVRVEGTTEYNYVELKGARGEEGPRGLQGVQGIQGIQGPAGKDFSIYKTYPSITLMNADKDNVEEGNFVMIASTIEEEDNAKLYVKGTTEFIFITDLSGSQGMKGEKGEQGIQGPQGETGPQGPKGEGIPELKETLSGQSIIVNNSADSKCKLNVKGNSEQETRSGKNLLNFDGLNTLTINGLTITNNKDGSITLNGTTTDAVSIRISNVMNNLYSGNYYLSRNSSGTSTNEFSLILYATNGTPVRIGTATNVSPIKADIDYEQYYLWMYISSGITFTNYIIKPQLELGTAKTNWELYGVCPSLDYPSEIKSCGDNINLVSNTYRYGNENNNTKGNRISLADMPYVLEGKTYTISTNMFDVLTNMRYYAVICPDLMPTSSSVTYDSGWKTNIKEFTFTANSSGYLGIIISKIGEDIDIPLVKDVWWKVEEGSKATPYTEYGQGCITEIISNKNLFDINKFNESLSLLQKHNISSFTKIENGLSFVSSGTDSYFTIPSSNSSYNLVSMKIEELKTYVLSYTSEGSNSINKYLFFMDNKYNIIKSNVWLSSKNISSFTTPENSSYVFIRFGVINQSGTTINITNIQLEQGTEQTSYEEHKEQTISITVQKPFRSIGETRDEFVKKDGKWYERHYIGEVIFDGNEEWSYKNQTFRTPLENAITNMIYEIAIKSNYYKSVIYETDWDNTKYWIVNHRDNKVAIISHPSITSVNNFKTWLSTHNTIVDYVLSTPEDIECTKEQNIILNNLPSTYKGTTHIYNTDEVSSILELAYYTNNEINNVLPKKEEVEALTNIINYNEENKEVYSAEEVRIGTWIDGKPLYRKVFNFSYESGTTTASISTELTNIDFCCNVNTIIVRNNNDYENTYYFSNTDFLRVFFRNDNQTIEVRSSSFNWSTSMYVTLEYTKTTD